MCGWLINQAEEKSIDGCKCTFCGMGRSQHAQRGQMQSPWRRQTELARPQGHSRWMLEKHPPWLPQLPSQLEPDWQLADPFC